MAVNVRVDDSEIRRQLRSESGGVMRDMIRRGRNVEGRAKRLCPVNTGRLRSSITMEVVSLGDRQAIRVGTNVKYAQFVHNGRGPVVPVSASVLAFNVRGQMVFTKRSRATDPQPFLENALPAAQE